MTECLSFEAKIERQLKMEEEGIQEGVKAYRDYVLKKARQGELSETPPAMRILEEIMEPMMDGIDEFKADRRVTGGGAGFLHQVRDWLQDVGTPELAYITIRNTLDMMTDVQPLQKVCIRIGRAVEDYIEYTKFKEECPGYVYKLEESFTKQGSSNKHRRTVLLKKKRDLGIEDEAWPEDKAFNVGLKLLDILIRTTGVVQKENTYLDVKKPAVIIIPTERTKSFMKKAHEIHELLKPMRLPMIVPPLDWEGIYGGGFLTQPGRRKSRLIKSRCKDHHAAQQAMPEVLDAVNALQHTAWRINRGILDVLTEVWTNTDGLGLVPDTTEPQDKLPPKPWSSDAEYERMKADDNKKAIVDEWKLASQEIWGTWYREQSKRYNTAKKIAIGTKLRDEEEIFFVYFLDWRGRIYPVQNYVNPQSDDSGSALIEFAHGKPLTEAGVKWLAVHVANSYGYDKVSLNDRVQWVHDHEEQILACARDPLGEGYMWRELNKKKKPKADSPFCFLAACMAWAGYKEQGPDYVCHLPIQVDGSCNGLQHFAALLGDEVGGAAVNLCPCNDWDTKPSDVYGLVATDLTEHLEPLTKSKEVFKEKEGKNGTVKHYVADLARALLPHVGRSMVKRNVMTTPYGATKRGMAGQNRKFMRDEKLTGIYKDELVLAEFLTHHVYESIGRVVIAARQAMDWMKALADCYNKAKLPIKWVTPTGFTVVQATMKSTVQQIKSVFGGERIRLKLKKDTKDLDGSAQKNGIAPNFVHSMDATHLVRTINACVAAGVLDHSMIHDSYGSHACDMDKYAEVLRDEFVRIYCGNHHIKERLEVVARETIPKQAKKLPPAPEKGGLDFCHVLEQVNFFK